jgi:hypothetical protein
MINPASYLFFARFGAKNMSDLPQAKLTSDFRLPTSDF